MIRCCAIVIGDDGDCNAGGDLRGSGVFTLLSVVLLCGVGVGGCMCIAGFLMKMARIASKQFGPWVLLRPLSGLAIPAVLTQLGD
jgi:hypothetical protein